MSYVYDQDILSHFILECLEYGGSIYSYKKAFSMWIWEQGIRYREDYFFIRQLQLALNVLQVQGLADDRMIIYPPRPKKSFKKRMRGSKYRRVMEYPGVRISDRAAFRMDYNLMEYVYK